MNIQNSNSTSMYDFRTTPDDQGQFGEYGGIFVPDMLRATLEKINETYQQLRSDQAFLKELDELYANYVGRPSPIFPALNLSAKCGGATIYLKREDLNHTGAHKINHCLGEALIARRMGIPRLIAETGAGQHGVALATAAALCGLECHIYMGEVDMKKERPNVIRMKTLGATVIPVTRGLGTLKEAVDAALEAYVGDPVNQFYAIGSVVGPHPFPMMVRDFQSVIGREARAQFKSLTGSNPDHLVACVGGGSNAMGLFSGFLDDPDVMAHGVEPAGKGLHHEGGHAATLTLGRPGVIHGFRCYLLQDAQGEPAPVYSVASGLDYPGVGPEHSLLRDLGRVKYETITDSEAIDAFFTLARIEGIIPALESAHAVAQAMKLASSLSPDKTILVNLSGRGDKDIDFVIEQYGSHYGI
ncbi:MAG: tryptophan synthase subunit beta [Candidatus Wallbacteria bacterium HGW-Wallbacteria-1]|uniref:Tryptophan synthase beta chain n=1 Tax=Candidatus Wallbacteria bacterium HGW-Wallbacteria-1 TaxID=2013854 RepID=A0A2N1PNW6_9BACT|nr:MAG: tryptophan synthase subunit beta [Candidatus Wallbacteria bacterium HGW-Wallbacteria-1]